MADVVVDADRFGTTLEQLLERVGTNVRHRAPEAIEGSLSVGEKAWKKNARSVLSRSYSRGGWGRARPDATRYKSGPRKGQVKSGFYGRVIKTGKYARSIRHQMLATGGDAPDGEIGSASMPGLAHLLEKGHASVGGGFVSGREHIAPAADEAFADFEERLSAGVERAIDEA